jgi:hypothetical protein
MSLEICTMLVLSTEHLDPAARRALSDGAVIAYEKGEYGWFVYAGSAAAGPDLAPLRAVLSFAAHHGAEWVCFDRDGPVVETLARWEW